MPNRLIAIGDIHGQRRKLEQLLRLLQATEKDQLVFLGDYIDRGPDSRGVIETLLELRNCLPETIFLKGNHEQMLLNALLEENFLTESIFTDLSTPNSASLLFSDITIYLRNGGMATLKSYGIKQLQELPRTHLEFIRQTRLYFRMDGFLFVHAGARDDLPLEEQDEYTLLWERNSAPGSEEIHVVGHSPTPGGQPLFEEGRYSLDTGAGLGNQLTACDVYTRQIWQS
ncbi:MAG: metallophosphoesterase family protein [Desulfuromonadaceae bacterium]